MRDIRGLFRKVLGIPMVHGLQFKNHCLRILYGHGSLVFKESDHGWPCHGFESSTTKDPQCGLPWMSESVTESEKLSVTLTVNHQKIVGKRSQKQKKREKKEATTSTFWIIKGIKLQKKCRKKYFWIVRPKEIEES
ncbi:hypothetical protein TNCV_3373781 [Trichonephila clavipes]|nr:hypothetical protein TNCV_3373781 [Trichonephila clavipes]